MNRKLILLVVILLTHSSFALSYMLPISAKITNNSAQPVGLYCQATKPAPECYGEGCILASWPDRNIQPNETKNVELWIFRDDKATLLLSVIGPLQETSNKADEYTVAQFQNNNGLYYGDLTFTMNRSFGGIDAMHRGNFQYNIGKEGGKYVLSLVIK